MVLHNVKEGTIEGLFSAFYDFALSFSPYYFAIA